MDSDENNIKENSDSDENEHEGYCKLLLFAINIYQYKITNYFSFTIFK